MMQTWNEIFPNPSKSFTTHIDLFSFAAFVDNDEKSNMYLDVTNRLRNYRRLVALSGN